MFRVVVVMMTMAVAVVLVTVVLVTVAMRVVGVPIFKGVTARRNVHMLAPGPGMQRLTEKGNRQIDGQQR